MDPTPPPVLLLPPGDGDRPDERDDLVVPAGWQVRPGFDLPAEPWDLRPAQVVCVGTVDDAASAEAAMTAVARGAGLALLVALQGAPRHRFLEDLHKVSEPEPYQPGAAASSAASLTPAQRDLLDALAEGATVTAAAAALHVSRRTANRLLADARSQLGVDTTAAAVRRWIGLRPSPGR